jgi:hypothetical protein
MKQNAELSEKTIVFGDKNTQITITHKEDGTYLTALGPSDGDNLLRRETLLWKVTMTDTNRIHADLDMSGIKPGISRKGDFELIIKWEKAVIGGTAQDVNVIASIRIADKALHWNISVTDIPENWSVFRVHFPIMDIAAKPNNEYKIIIPLDRGICYENPLENLPTGGWFEELRIRPYPYAGFSMQFMCIQRKEKLFYFAAHDPQANCKNFFFGPDKDNRLIYIHPYVSTLVRYGEDYVQSFPWVTMCTRGDWFDAAQIYRNFAMSTPWCKNKGKLADGKKTPRWYQEIPIVSLRLLRGPEYQTEDIIEEKQFFNVPIISHYYMWHHNDFDGGNPFFFPAVPGFRKVVETLREHEIHVMPYINAYTSDTTGPEWETGLKECACVKNEEGELKVETYSQNLQFAVMCPQASLWKRLVNLVAMRLVEMGIRCIYHDQLAQSGPWPCYSRNHGHLPGGARNFVEPQLKYLENICNESRDIIGDVINTAEGNAEPYIEHLDGCLTGNYNFPDAVPLFEAVYHDYVISFGRYTFTQELTEPRFEGAITSKHAQQFVWGCQFGWSRVPLHAIIQKDKEAALFLKHLAHCWIHNSDYLARGKMMRPLDLSDQIQQVKRTWAQTWTDNRGCEVKLPSVLNSVWQAYDGSIGIVLVNITKDPQKLKIKLPNIFEIISQNSKEKIIADNLEATADIESAKNSTHFYPCPQRAVAQLRYVKDEKLIKTICPGDSESGYDVQIPGLSCCVICIGSEKRFGFHEYNL